MVRSNVIARKVARASSWLDDAEPVFRRSLDASRADRPGRDLATFYLFLAIQECIDISAHFVADEGWGSPDDAAGTFDILADRGIVGRPVADGMRGATALRNGIAHGYTTVDPGRIHEDAGAGIPLIRLFLVAVSTAAGV
jgi:uncharacterized protein YutE (UPF0331/DUF86 family)